MKHVDYIQTWKEVMQSPSDFFRKMPITGGYFYPIVFATGSAAILTFTRLIFSPDKKELIELLSLAPTVVAVILLAISVTALFVDATGLHIVYKALGGTGTYEGTTRFVLYSSASASLIFIPFIGWIFGLYQTYLYIVGGRFVHDISMVRSLMALIMSSLLVFVFVLLVSMSVFV